MNPLIPKPSTPIIDKRTGLMSREWFLYLANLGAAAGIAMSAGTGFASTGTVSFADSNGITFGLETNGVMTASFSGGGGGGSGSINVSAGGASADLTNLVFSNSNGLAFGLNGSTITGSYSQSTHAHPFAGTNGAITGGSITVNTSGVSVNLPAYLTTAQPVGAYLTTAMASNRGSDFVQATAVFAGTNATGTIASNGISVSVAAPGLTSQSNQAISAGNGVFTFQTATFADSNGVSFSTGTQGLYATVKTDYQTSGNYLTTAMASNQGSDFVQATAAFAGTNASGTIASNGISVSVANAAAGATLSFWPPVMPSTSISTLHAGSTNTIAATSQTGTTHSYYINQMIVPAAIVFSDVRLVVNLASAAGTGSVTHQYSFGFYSRSGNTLSLVKSCFGGVYMSQNSTTAMTLSVWTASTNTVNSIYSTQGNDPNYPVGVRWMPMGDGSATTLTAGQYYYALGVWTFASSTPPLGWNGVIQSVNMAVPTMMLGIPPSANNQIPLFYNGVLSTRLSSQSDVATFWPMPQSIALSNVTIPTGVTSNQTTVYRQNFPILSG